MADPVTIGLTSGALAVATAGLLGRAYSATKEARGYQGTTTMWKAKDISKPYYANNVSVSKLEVKGSSNFTLLPNGAIFASGNGVGDSIEYAGSRTIEYNPQMIKGKTGHDVNQAHIDYQSKQMHALQEQSGKMYYAQLGQQQKLQEQQYQHFQQIQKIQQQQQLLMQMPVNIGSPRTILAPPPP